MTTLTDAQSRLLEVAYRIREMREIAGYSVEQMAKLTEVTVEQYEQYEDGLLDFPFTFIHKCSKALDIGITDILEGQSAKLTSYTVTRKGEGQATAQEKGKDIRNLAPLFRNRIAEPYWVRYEYDETQEHAPIHTTTHSGQEFDLVISGCLMVKVGSHVEMLYEGDSIYYNSSTPHGMIAVGGEDCQFLAMIMAGEPEKKQEEQPVSIPQTPQLKEKQGLVAESFIRTTEDENGALKAIAFKNTDSFNFAFDVLDVLGRRKSADIALVHVDRFKNERFFTFGDVRRYSARAANYFKSLGIGKGDRVMLVLRRNYQFWFCMLAMNKLGAVVVPATDQLVEHDYVYRFNAAGIKAVVCSSYGVSASEIEKSLPQCPSVKTLVMSGGKREGWHDFDGEFRLFSDEFIRPAPGETGAGEDPMLMFFTSGTTGYPKVAVHDYKYPLGHYITAKYWHCVEPGGLHLTISDTGWGKAMWGKLYGQWLAECAVFVYDFDRFDAADILSLFKKYNITTFCCPPTMYRFMIKEDLSKYDLSSIKNACVAGEALNPEVFQQFRKATGLSIKEAFGQTETTMVIGNLTGAAPKVGSMGKPSPLYDVELLGADGEPVELGESGEICINLSEGKPNGLFCGYYRDKEKTDEVWHDGWYHTGDLAWKDEDGYYWYVGRADDVIKSSGYRIGPFEIESVIMELPYVLECGVSAAPDPVRGQVVKASIVLVKGKEGDEALKKEIQSYVKEHTAPYKYPRIVDFRTELPKTISGKIIRNQL